MWSSACTFEEAATAMYERPYDLVQGRDGYRVRIRARGKAVLTSSMLNRGTAFTAPERRAAWADRSAASCSGSPPTRRASSASVTRAWGFDRGGPAGRSPHFADGAEFERQVGSEDAGTTRDR